jgi:exodeoxyribonuclease V alpha subunit
MVKHVSVRVAWHDSCWNGRICKSPEENFYCVGNYSLLSPRIQRRINVSLEAQCKGQVVSDVIRDKGYLPPCYWTINIQGEDTLSIEDPHPFSDTKTWGEKFKTKVPPLRDVLKDHSVFTWCFKLSFEKEDSNQRYPHPEELKRRIDEYLGELVPGKTIVFFYSNFSNPITGDEYKYLLIGAGLLRGIEKPKHYDIPEDLLREIRSKPKMKNFPTMAWQFQLMLDPDTIIILPYQKYLEWFQENSIDVHTKWRKLKEIAIPIEEENLIPHFKYVSMHIPHDKCIYLLYLMKKTLEKMKEHKLIDYEELKRIEDNLDKLLKIAWSERGAFPGFSNVIKVLLKNDFGREHLKKLVPKIQEYIKQEFGSLEAFLESQQLKPSVSNPQLNKALEIIWKRKELIEFLSRFDFSEKQFERVLEIVYDVGENVVRNNPYIILERYQYDQEDELSIDESDYGISLYQIDIALIPDPSYANWPALYEAQAPERVRAIITKILYDAALRDGHSCLTRDEILKLAEEYPLYYINAKLRLDKGRLLEYEKQPIFKEKFVIKEVFEKGEVVYQLKTVREMEKIIEDFISTMLKKKYELSQKDRSEIEAILKEEKEREEWEKRLDLNERRRLYESALSYGAFFISGRAGSGKTSAITRLIKKFMDDGHRPIYVFTPTGKANLVIRKRLKESGVRIDDKYLVVSTIHRFLYTKLFEYAKAMSSKTREQISKIVNLVEKILSGKFECLSELSDLIKQFQLRPRILIIDEASMVDEALMALLFLMISPEELRHLIVVGDEKQLPPIGIGRPFIDIVYHLKKCGLEANYIRLESSLRFDPKATIGALAEFFSSEKPPTLLEVSAVLNEPDETMELFYFKSIDELREVIRQILQRIGTKLGRATIAPSTGPLAEMFSNIFEDKSSGKLDLDKVQVICPTRVGDFGTMAINIRVIRGNDANFTPRTKLICEKNIYTDAVDKNGRRQRILALANGSIGYIESDGSVYFEDLEDLEAEYKWVNTRPIENKIIGDFAALETDRDIDFGYAITVHKSQGSDFDYVIFVLPEVTPFVTKELLYTAFTRPKEKLYFVVHSNLKEELPLRLCQAYENSSIESRKTLLFEYKASPSRPYIVTLRSGETIEVRSKVEYIMAKALDDAGVEFKYEPREFLEEYHIVPDFKILIDGEAYYIEHLGNMNNPSYRNRWFQKFEVYKKLGLVDKLITTSESEEKSDIEGNVKKIVEDIKSKRVKRTEGSYSLHHYYI